MRAHLPSSSACYYDVVLALIPLLFTVGWIVSVVAAVPLSVGMVPGGVVAALLIGHALFVQPPVETDVDASEVVQG